MNQFRTEKINYQSFKQYKQSKCTCVLFRKIVILETLYYCLNTVYLITTFDSNSTSHHLPELEAYHQTTFIIQIIYHSEKMTCRVHHLKGNKIAAATPTKTEIMTLKLTSTHPCIIFTQSILPIVTVPARASEIISSRHKKGHSQYTRSCNVESIQHKNVLIVLGQCHNISF